MQLCSLETSIDILGEIVHLWDAIDFTLSIDSLWSSMGHYRFFNVYTKIQVLLMHCLVSYHISFSATTTLSNGQVFPACHPLVEGRQSQLGLFDLNIDNL